MKLDTVVLRGVNQDELEALVRFAVRQGAEIRFIEYMDVGGATRWSWDRVVTARQMREQLERALGPLEPVPGESSAPARLYRLGDGTILGIVASTTAPFCSRCDRSRLTADGHLYLCLYAHHGLDLKGMLRGGAGAQELEEWLAQAWRGRRDHGAEHRRRERQRASFIPLERLRQDPRPEMHARGG